MRQTVFQNIFYVLKVCFTGAYISVVFILLIYAANRRSDLIALWTPGVLFTFGLTFFFHSLIVCSLLLGVVRYVITRKWSYNLIRFVISISWFGAAIVAVLIVPRLLMGIDDILNYLQIQISTADQDDLAFTIFGAILILWPLTSVVCTWCYKLELPPSDTVGMPKS